jgi:phage baseplate assembly protein W
MNAIGPKLPLHRDDKFGSYGLISSYVNEVKQNFKNLLLTSPGERMMNPDFGVGLKHFLFEPKVHVVSKIRQRLQNQVSKYMPFVRINKVRFNQNVDPKFVDDSNVLSVLIEYDVPSINLSTSITIQSEDMN